MWGEGRLTTTAGGNCRWRVVGGAQVSIGGWIGGRGLMVERVQGEKESEHHTECTLRKE